MRIQLRLFPVMATLFLVLAAAACGGNAVHTLDRDPIVMAPPSDTAVPPTVIAVPPTVTAVTALLPAATEVPLAPNVSVTGPRSKGARALVGVATPQAESDENSVAISHSIPTVVIYRAPEPPPTATSIPTVSPTQPAERSQISTLLPIPEPTATPEPTPTLQPTATIAVSATPTVISPTATAIAAPVANEVIQLTGTDDGGSAVFWSPKRLPWVVEWDAWGAGSSAVVLTLMDPDGDIEVVELVSDSGSGQVGGLTWVHGNMGKFYVRVEGVEGDWEIWVRPQ